MKTGAGFFHSLKTEEYYAGVMLSVTAAFMLCVFEPLCIYFLSSSDFIFDVYTLLPVCAVLWIAAAGIGILLYTIFFRIVPKICEYVLYLFFSLYLCMYLQGNYFVGALSLLDGSDIDWSGYTVQYVQSILLWLAVFLATGVAFIKLKRETFYKAVRVTALVMFLIFVITAAVTGYFNYGFDRKPSIAVTDRNVMEYSPDKNFIILVVDQVDVEYENLVLEKYPEDKEFLKDFTYYDNVVAGYCYTENALPFLLGGKWYEGREPFDEYKEWSYLHSPLVSAVKDEGYVRGIYTDELSTSKDSLELDNTADITRRLENPAAFAGAWMKLVGYKYLPYPLKQYSRVLPAEFTEPFTDKVDDLGIWEFYDSNFYFYNMLMNDEMVMAEDGHPRFKFLHIAGAHHPHTINRDVEYVHSASYMDCVEGTDTIIKTYLDRLKKEGVYDNSVIIILSDHGVAEADVSPIGHQDPILFIKGFGETHETMRTDSAPISQEDYVEAFLKLLRGETGDDVFPYKEGDVRERRCLVFQNGRYDEYIQKGHASDLTTFIPTGKWYLPLR